MFILLRSTCLPFFLEKAHFILHAISKIKEGAFYDQGSGVTITGRKANTPIILGLTLNILYFWRILTYIVVLDRNITIST